MTETGCKSLDMKNIFWDKASLLVKNQKIKKKDQNKYARSSMDLDKKSDHYPNRSRSMPIWNWSLIM